jgi:transcriptional regulator with XRE-family HTH domain
LNQRRSPLIRRRRLGTELRRYREIAGVTIDVVADRLGCSASKVSRIETGQSSATPRDVFDMLTVYGVDAATAHELVQMAREARQKGWWHPYSRVLTGAYVGLEAGARSIRAFDMGAVPGLLQTEEYALQMLRTGRPDITDMDELDRRLRVRMQRQSLLIQDDPISLWVVLDEAVLSRPVGGDAVMRHQLDQLVVAADMPNVTIQVLPFEAGAHAGLDGTFAILDFPEADDPDMVFAENATGGLFLEGVDELTKFSYIFRSIQAAALSPEDSVALIAELAKEPLWKTRPRASRST